MRTYRNLFQKMITDEVITKSILDAATGKLRRKDVNRAFNNFDETYDRIMSCISDPDYRPCEDNIHEIIDGANHKPREIEKPKFCPEQILHHMIIEVFKPVLLDGLYEQVYGCLPKIIKEIDGKKVVIRKFGPHAAIKRLKKWIQINKKIYVCETDVHQAYASVSIPILVNQLKRVIKDDDWLKLTYKFLHYDPNNINQDLRGLTLGHYTSPWLFNFYLKQFDHYAATLEGVKYLRFADNIFLVGTNKRKVHKALDNIKSYLKRYLKLKLNKCTQVYRFEYGTGQFNKKGKEITRGRAVNALGTVIHYNRLTLRKSILYRIRKKSVKIGKKSKVTWHDGASMFSRMSWIRFTNTYKYYIKYIKCNINTRLLKRKVRNHSRLVEQEYKNRRRNIYAGLENSTRISRNSSSRVRSDIQCSCSVSA